MWSHIRRSAKNSPASLDGIRLLFRDTPALEQQRFLADAMALLSGDFSELADLSQAFVFHIDETSIEFDFDFPVPGRLRFYAASESIASRLRRVIVLVGRNGSGKSTLLSRIAHLAYASPRERGDKELSAIGRFSPPAIGFVKVITVSYSAFDSFSVPGTREHDLRQLAKEVEKSEGRFVYCGLRDIVAEVRDDIGELPKM